MDEVRDAFKKVKEDVYDLGHRFFIIKEDLEKMKSFLVEVGEGLYSLNKKVENLLERNSKTDEKTFQSLKTQNPTNNLFFRAQKGKIQGISTGNEGVQTDRQTDRQTDKRGEKEILKEENSFEEASNLIDSLDNVRKEIRLKFKKLTDQEIVLFSAIYQLEEEMGFADYKTLSSKLSLSESSVRDYVRRLILKGIPLEKKKINNKEIHLFVSQNLKKIVSLSAILKLRDL